MDWGFGRYIAKNKINQFVRSNDKKNEREEDDGAASTFQSGRREGRLTGRFNWKLVEEKVGYQTYRVEGERGRCKSCEVFITSQLNML